jgi:UDP-N-acetylglucosamine diphosphorylase / glucose-1-phosphate thymidylyltransferase / UDP-N-acetylgalactosamine diphosphorylase / glucosamine-1-phosphate N-acetyltransferase / galactosamine-1-phosphate N-acetyltransferase
MRGRLGDHIAECAASPWAAWADRAAWELAAQCESLVRAMLESLSAADYEITNGVAIHRSATVESGAVLKGPLVLGPGCFVAAGAYLRGGNWLAHACTVGPGVELKSSFVFSDSALAHFNFVGDSIIGAGVNLEAGSVVCNHRNEHQAVAGAVKFGALIGDGSRIGANAVLAPGTVLPPRTIVARLALVDQAAASNAATASPRRPVR